MQNCTSREKVPNRWSSTRFNWRTSSSRVSPRVGRSSAACRRGRRDATPAGPGQKIQHQPRTARLGGLVGTSLRLRAADRHQPREGVRGPQAELARQPQALASPTSSPPGPPALRLRHAMARSASDRLKPRRPATSASGGYDRRGSSTTSRSPDAASMPGAKGPDKALTLDVGTRIRIDLRPADGTSDRRARPRG